MGRLGQGSTQGGCECTNTGSSSAVTSDSTDFGRWHARRVPAYSLQARSQLHHDPPLPPQLTRRLGSAALSPWFSRDRDGRGVGRPGRSVVDWQCRLTS